MANLFEQYSVRYITDFMRDFGFKDFQAAGFPGNFAWESGEFKKLQEGSPRGGGRGGLGHGQFTGDRREDFERWIARHKDDGWNAGTYEANYSQAWRELTPGSGAASDESHVVALLRAANSVEEATQIVCLKFERPAADARHMPERIEYARKALALFRASGVDPAKTPPYAPPNQKAEPIVLPPVAQLPTFPALQSGFDLQTILPLVLGFLSLLQRQQGDATGKQPDIMELLALIQTRMQPGASVAPAPIVVAPAKSSSPLTSPAWWGTALTGILGSAGLMATGTLGTPLGMGEAPSLAGNLVPLAFAALPAIASMFGPVGSAVGGIIRIIGQVATTAQQSPKL